MLFLHLFPLVTGQWDQVLVLICQILVDHHFENIFNTDQSDFGLMVFVLLQNEIIETVELVINSVFDFVLATDKSDFLFLALEN